MQIFRIFGIDSDIFGRLVEVGVWGGERSRALFAQLGRGVDGFANHVSKKHCLYLIAYFQRFKNVFLAAAYHATITL